MGWNGYSTMQVHVPDEVKAAFDRVIDKSFQRMQTVVRAASPSAAALVLANNRGVRASHRRHMFCVIVYLLDKSSPEQLESVIADADSWLAQLEEDNYEAPKSLHFRRPQGGE